MARVFSALVWLCFCVLVAQRAGAHDPNNVPEPRSIPEAWNTIQQSVANVGVLIENNQLKEVQTHVANVSAPLRLLQGELKRRTDAHSKAIHDKLEALYTLGSDVILAGREKEDPGGKAAKAYGAYRAAVADAASHYDDKLVNAQVYICTMHPLDRHLEAEAVCTLCRMKLIRRRIPPSTVYVKPGEPSIAMSVSTGAPLRAGQKAEARVALRFRKSGGPVTPPQLLTMHTEKIHLLIIDTATLSDYHHEHPRLSDVDGQYTFSFTPKTAGPYRVFADMVPAESSIQEYAVADVPAGGKVSLEPPADPAARLTANVDGFTFTLAFRGKQLVAGQPQEATLTVSGPGGKPFRQLEPVMGAYAHLVAFHEDRATVLHIHPGGAEPARETERGGPALPVTIYAPKAGFYRLFAQVQIEGRSRFAPFNIVVAPGGKG
jgi:hypothetical protein